MGFVTDTQGTIGSPITSALSVATVSGIDEYRLAFSITHAEETGVDFTTGSFFGMAHILGPDPSGKTPEDSGYTATFVAQVGGDDWASLYGMLMSPPDDSTQIAFSGYRLPITDLDNAGNSATIAMMAAKSAFDRQYLWVAMEYYGSYTFSLNNETITRLQRIQYSIHKLTTSRHSDWYWDH